MDRSEFMKVVVVIRSVYQKDDFLKDEASASVWYSMLKDLTYEQIVTAVQKHALTNKWPPSIAELREHTVDIKTDRKDWSEGWGEVLKAVRRHGYMNEREALESMSEVTREIVKRLGWQQICQSELDELTAIRANFRMAYENMESAERENAQLPDGFIEKARMAIGQGDRNLLEQVTAQEKAL